MLDNGPTLSSDGEPGHVGLDCPGGVHASLSRRSKAFASVHKSEIIGSLQSVCYQKKIQIRPNLVVSYQTILTTQLFKTSPNS